MNLAVVHVYVRLDERQTDARAADGALRLVEALEEMWQFLSLNTLARIGDAQRVAVVAVLQRNADASILRRILQCVRHYIKVYMLHLVAVCNQHRIVLHARHIHAYRDATACRHRAEVLSPCRQFLLQAEAVEVQLSLVVLHLAEVENLAHKLYQYSRVALHHLQHRALPTLYRRVFEQLFCRSGDERQRRAQFVTHVREELQLRLRHLLHLLRHSALLVH